MKSVLTLILLLGSIAQARPAIEGEFAQIKNVTKLDCVVPVQNAPPSVRLDVSLSNDTSVDFITVTVIGVKSKDVLFTQIDKGSLDSQLKAGAVSIMVIQEGFAQEAGVIKKAGALNLQKTEDGRFSGVMLAMANIYPLSCALK
jgi:hypothetical protein